MIDAFEMLKTKFAPFGPKCSCCGSFNTLMPFKNDKGEQMYSRIPVTSKESAMTGITIGGPSIAALMVLCINCNHIELFYDYEATLGRPLAKP